MVFSTALLTALLLALPGSQGLVMTQQKSLSVSPGASAKISCAIDSHRSWVITWYQQKTGSAPRFLLYDSTRGSGTPERFTASEESSGKMEYLNIASVQQEDEATYYCACHGCPSDGVTVFGGGTRLDVGGQSSSPPTLTLMPPSQRELSERGSATLVCLAQGFYPDSVSVSWAEDGQARSGAAVQTSAAQRQPDGTFSLTSLMSLTAAQWSSGHSFSCQLSHPALSSPLTRSVSLAECNQG
ncbi:immunoglobulin lambda-1 light chain-like [Lepisosteus oculatus]|uniref:immunoglobulin lambda-1 light chain-like n=1 Tax=Lepisosteus oculatus TaxID=7918 RepID=UPI0035F52783